MEKNIVCIGGASAETTAVAHTPVVLGSSTPVTNFSSFGGVARNVAESLARLGIATALSSRVGNDATGRSIVNHLVACGVDVSGIAISETTPSAKYTAINQPDGELVIGAADMEITKEITRDTLDIEQLSEASCVLVDTNLDAEALHTITELLPDTVPLWAISVSVPKTQRLEGIIPRLAGLFLNRSELKVLCPSAKSIEEGLRMLQDKGLQHPIVTLREEGVAYLEDGNIRQLCSPTTSVVDAGGAGDALAAGVLFGLHQDLTLEQSIRCGLWMARRTIGVMGAVDTTITKDDLPTDILSDTYANR